MLSPFAMSTAALQALQPICMNPMPALAELLLVDELCEYSSTHFVYFEYSSSVPFANTIERSALRPKSFKVSKTHFETLDSRKPRKIQNRKNV